MKRLTIKFALVTAMAGAALAMPARAEASTSLFVCGPFCVYNSTCSPATIPQLCAAACPGSTGGICGDDGSCGTGGFRLVCAGNVE